MIIYTYTLRTAYTENHAMTYMIRALVLAQDLKVYSQDLGSHSSQQSPFAASAVEMQKPRHPERSPRLL